MSKWQMMNPEQKYTAVLSARLAGKTFTQIAEELECTPHTAWHWCQRALKMNLKTDIEALRARQIEDINIAKAKLLAKQTWSGRDAIGFVSLLEHEARLFGMSFADKVIVEQRTTEDERLQAFLAGLADAIAETPTAQEAVDEYLRSFAAPAN